METKSQATNSAPEITANSQTNDAQKSTQPIVDAKPNDLKADRLAGIQAAPDAVPAAIKDAVQQAEAVMRKFKVKVDGQELEIDEAELLSDYQTKRASDKRFQEAAKLRKQAEEVISLLKSDPRAALRHPAIGADERALAEAILSEHIEAEMMDPKDRKIRDLERQLKADADAKAALAAQQQQQQLEAETERYNQEYQASIETALKSAGLPITNVTVRSMIGFLQNALEAEHNLEPKDVVGLVKQDYQRQLKELFSAADATTISDLLGEDGLKKVRGIEIAKLKSPQQVAPTPSPDQQGQPKERKPEPKKKVSDFFAELKKDIK